MLIFILIHYTYLYTYTYIHAKVMSLKHLYFNMKVIVVYISFHYSCLCAEKYATVHFKLTVCMICYYYFICIYMYIYKYMHAYPSFLL